MFLITRAFQFTFMRKIGIHGQEAYPPPLPHDENDYCAPYKTAITA